VKEDLTIRDMTGLMETMNGDHITANKMIEGVISLMEIAKTVLIMVTVTEDITITATGEDMVTATEDMVIATRDTAITATEGDIVITVMEEDTTTVHLLMETIVRLMGIIITVRTEIMTVNTIALVRKDIMTGL
jgi:hypothetical protein